MRFPLTRRRMLATGAAMALALGAAVAAAAPTDSPPPAIPFTAYGQVLVDGANVSPAEQPMVVFVNGVECGWTTTKVAVPGPGTPADDVGKTVYVVDVLADGGNGGGSKPGCGRPGDLVTFYFPQSHRMATQHPAWQSGAPGRTNLDLGLSLSHRLVVAGAAAKVQN